MISHFTSAGWTDTSKVKPPSISCVRNGTNSLHAAAFANWNRSAWLRCWTNHSSQRASQPDWQKLQHVAWAKAKDVFRKRPVKHVNIWEKQGEKLSMFIMWFPLCHQHSHRFKPFCKHHSFLSAFILWTRQSDMVKLGRLYGQCAIRQSFSFNKAPLHWNASGTRWGMFLHRLDRVVSWWDCQGSIRGTETPPESKTLKGLKLGEKNFHKSQAAYWTFAHDCAHLPSCKLLWTQQMPIANAHQQLTHAKMCFPLWARRGKMQRLQESRLSRRHEASHSKAFPHATLVRPPMSWCRKPLSHLATFIFGVCIVSQHLSYTSELCSCFLSVLLDIFKCLFSFLFKLLESICRNSLSFECPHLLSAHLPR